MRSLLRYILFLFSLVPIRFFAEQVADDAKIQSQENEKINFFVIDSIQVVGIEDEKKKQDILLCFGKKVGDVFSLDDYSSLNKAKENILSKCTFVESYTLTYLTEGESIRLYIKVKEAPLVTDIVTQDVKLSNDELLETIKGKKCANESVLLQLHDGCIGNIDLDNAELVIKTKNNENGACVEISKIEKKKTYINDVSFVGNTQISSKELYSSLLLTGRDTSVITFLNDSYDSLKLDLSYLKEKGQKLLGFFLPGKKKTLSKDSLEKDLNSILEKYHSRGFLNAKIKQLIIKYDEENSYCDITYVIEEGERFYVGDYDVSDTNLYSSLILKKVIGIKSGDIFDSKAIREKIFGSQDKMYLDGIKALFSREGYNNCSFSIRITKIVDNKVYFYIDIREGNKELVGEIIVKGNKHTSFRHFLKDSAIQPNTLFSSIDILRTQQNLSQNKAVDSKNPPVVLPLESPTRGPVRSFSKNIVFLVQEKGFIEPKAGDIRFTYLNNLWLHFLPYGTLSFILTNINLFKLFNLKDKKVSWLGNLHDLSFNLSLEFKDKGDDWFWFGLFDVKYYIPEVRIFGHTFSHSANIKINATPPSSNDRKDLDTDKIKGKIKRIATRELSYSFSLSFGTGVVLFGRPFSLSILPLSTRISDDSENCKMENVLILRHKTFRSDFYVYKGIDFKLSLYFPTLLHSAMNMVFSFKKPFKSRKCLILYHSQYFNPYKDFVIMYSVTAGFSVSNSCFNIKSAYGTDGTWGDSYEHSVNVTSFYIRGMQTDEGSKSFMLSYQNNFAVKFNCELRYLVLEKMLFNIYVYMFVNNGYEGKFKNIFKELHKLGMSTPYDLFKYSGVGVVVTLPLVGDFSVSVNFKDMFLSVTYGVESQNV